MRLFVALDLPQNVKKELNKICYGLSGVKWVTFEQMHLTLRFIGEVQHSQSVDIKTALAKVEVKPFEMSLKGVGQFPPKGAARVLWAGVEAPDELERLAKRVNDAVNALGFQPEERDFSAHITLARLKSPPSAEALRKYKEKNADFETPAFKIDRFVLYSSMLMPSGSVYKNEAEFRAK